MKVGIRRPAILFAVLSSVYWFLVADLIGSLSRMGGFDQQPYWKLALGSVVPGALYAVTTLYFCHWLVRRALRRARPAEEE